MWECEPFFNCLKGEGSYWFHFLRFDPFLLWLKFYPRPKIGGTRAKPFIEAYLFDFQSRKNFYIKEVNELVAVKRVRDGVQWGDNGVLYRSGMMGAISHLSWDFEFLSELKRRIFLRKGWPRFFPHEQIWIYICNNPYNGSITFRDQNYFIQQDVRSLAGVCTRANPGVPRCWGFFCSPEKNLVIQFLAYGTRHHKTMVLDFHRNVGGNGGETLRHAVLSRFVWSKSEIQFEFNAEGERVHMTLGIRDGYWIQGNGGEEVSQTVCFYPLVAVKMQNPKTQEWVEIHNQETDLAFLEMDGVIP
jgi:hypothetical protein